MHKAYAIWAAIVQLRVKYYLRDAGCDAHARKLPKVAGPLHPLDNWSRVWEKCALLGVVRFLKANSVR